VKLLHDLAVPRDPGVPEEADEAEVREDNRQALLEVALNSVAALSSVVALISRVVALQVLFRNTTVPRLSKRTDSKFNGLFYIKNH
jgi:hypothetical protein